MEEIWKDIPEFKGLYKASNLGRIKSLKRKGCLQDRVMTINADHDKYGNTSLRKDGKSYTCRPHQLVALAFLNHKPNGNTIVVDHIDGNMHNNRLDNLQLVTHAHNLKREYIKNKRAKAKGWSLCNGRIVGRIIIKNKVVYLGDFKCREKATAFYQMAVRLEAKYNGDNAEFRELIKSSI